MSRCSKMFQTCHLRCLSWMVRLLQIFLGNIVSQHRWSISSSSWPHPVTVQELISTRAKGTLLGPCWGLVGTLLVYPAVSRPSLMPPFLNLHPQTLWWLVLFLAMLSRLRQGQVVESSETPRGGWGSSLQSTVSGAVIDKGKQHNYLKSHVFFWKTQNESKPLQEISATSFK